MLRGAAWSAEAIVGTAVFRIVEPSDSMKTPPRSATAASAYFDVLDDGCGHSKWVTRGQTVLMTEIQKEMSGMEMHK